MPVHFLTMIFLAFLGGIILNLMPCVLPVLSLKIFDFVQKAGNKRHRIFGHGLAFTTGTLISFWTLAGLLDRKSTRLNSSHMSESRMPSSA